MPKNAEVAGFIAEAFRSVWALELLLLLKRDSDRSWPLADMVAGLCASELVVSTNLDVLLNAGLISVDADGSAVFSPASHDIARLADAVEALYATSPHVVRRVIASSSRSAGMAAFANAFRLRKD